MYNGVVVRYEAFSRNVCCFQSDFTLMNQIKMLRIVTFLKICSPGRKRSMTAHSISRGKYCGGRVIPKRMPGENIFESFHKFS